MLLMSPTSLMSAREVLHQRRAPTLSLVMRRVLVNQMTVAQLLLVDQTDLSV